MAEIPFNQLPSLGSINASDELMIEQLGVTGRSLVSNLVTPLNSSLDHTALLNIGSNTHPQLDNHLASSSNPHSVTKSQVGLGNVEDLKVNLTATVAPAVGNDNTEGYAVGSRWIDVTGDNEYVCLDASTGAAVWIATTSVAKGVIEVVPGTYTSSARAPYSTRAAGSTAQTYYSFQVPDDFTTVDTCLIKGIAGATAAGLDIDVIINWHQPNEAYNANSNSDTTSTFSVTVDEDIVIDAAPLMGALTSGDFVGVNIDHNGIGQSIYYGALKFRYNRF